MASNDVKLVFDYLDTNKDGFVSYNEYCQLCEEKRRDIDPFELRSIQDDRERATS